jgi:hypothetical protein
MSSAQLNGRPVLQITLVHNHAADRNAYLVPLLTTLAGETAARFTEVAWQPPVVPHDRWMRLYRDWRNARMAIAWAHYRGRAGKAWRQQPRVFLRQCFAALGNAEAELRRRRSSFIETCVTAKHIAAWTSFLESGADHLLVCEDDLVFRPDSNARFAAALAAASQAEGLQYVDLAGGFSPPDLGVDRLEAGRDGDRVLYDPAVTNTGCSYLLSRPLANEFMAIVQRRPRLRLIGISGMINTMLMDMRKRGLACTAVHYDPTVFGHGSFTGDYVSWLAVVLDKADPYA